MSLLVRNAIVEGERRSILIREGRIAKLLPAEASHAPDAGSPGQDPTPERAPPPDRVLDAEGLHAFPSLKNGHTHVAMVLFRGYGDDMPLMEWLRTRIWPAEARLTEDDVRLGARLGILEMIRGGTTFFNEMYWHRPGIVHAVEEMGVRAWVGSTLIDIGDPAVLDAQKAELEALVAARRAGATEADGRVELAVAPHSIYTLSPDVLRWAGDVARQADLPVHVHLSETEEEVERCLSEHGCRPAFLLDRLGLVDANLVAVHGQFLDEGELELLGAAGATLVTNPSANMKLATGGIFPYRAARAAGVRVCVGTDGAASNNNLDLIEELKIAALVQKHRERDATVLPAPEALAMATTSASEAFRLGPGTLTEGAPADLILVDLQDPSTAPVHDPVSALVYAASAANVRTTICAGRVLMHDRRVEVCDEEEVVAQAVEVARRVVGR